MLAGAPGMGISLLHPLTMAHVLTVDTNLATCHDIQHSREPKWLHTKSADESANWSVGSKHVIKSYNMVILSTDYCRLMRWDKPLLSPPPLLGAEPSGLEQQGGDWWGKQRSSAACLPLYSVYNYIFCRNPRPFFFTWESRIYLQNRTRQH